jgi:hypothetical protein
VVGDRRAAGLPRAARDRGAYGPARLPFAPTHLGRPATHPDARGAPEAGYLSHEADAARLADPEFRDTLAEAVVVAVQRVYLSDQDEGATGTLRLADVLARVRTS